MAKFGIVVPYVEEHEKLLPNCIRSIYEASENSSVSVDIIKIEDPFREGVPSTLNFVLKFFQHDYFGYFGADDIMLPNAFKNLENFNGAWCYGDCLMDGKPYYAGIFDAEKLKKKNYIPSGSVFVRSDIIKSIKFNEDIKFGEDWEMWLQISKNYEPFYINQFQYNYSTTTSTFTKAGLGKRRFVSWWNRRKFR